MPGRVYNSLTEIALDQYGFVTARDARANGIDPHRLVEMARRGTLERVSHGIYRMPVIAPSGLEQLMEATLWPRGEGVLSHETALDLHGLCDVNPAKIHVTVPRSHRLTREIPARYAIHRRDLEPREITLHEGIPVVTPARAILDGLEPHLRGDLLDQAFATARRRGLLRKADLYLLEEKLGPRGSR